MNNVRKRQGIPTHGDLRQTPFVHLLKVSLAIRACGRFEVVDGVHRATVIFRDGLPVAAWGANRRESVLARILGTDANGQTGSANEYDELIVLSRDAQYDPDAVRRACADVGHEVIKGLATWSDGDFKFALSRVSDNPLASLVDPFEAYLAYLEEFVPGEQLVSEMMAISGNTLVLTEMGMARGDLLGRCFKQCPQVEEAIANAQLVGSLMAAAGGDLNAAARVVSALIALGAIRAEIVAAAIPAPSPPSSTDQIRCSEPPPKGPSTGANRDDNRAVAEILFQDGLTYLTIGDLDEARAHFLKASHICPDRPAYRAYLGWGAVLADTDSGTLAARGRQLVADASAAAPRSEWTQLALAMVKSHDGDSRASIAAYEKVLSINPANTAAAAALAALKLTEPG